MTTRCRALAVLPYAIGRVGSQRYRIEQWIPRLRDCGVDVTARSFFGPRVLAVLHRPGHVVAKLLGSAAGYLGRTRSWPSRRDCDVVFLHREAFPLGPSALDHAYVSRVPYIFDFDDAIFLPAANSEHRWAAGLKSAGKTALLCRDAAHVTAGNEYLAEYARRTSAAVSVVPTTVDTDQYVPRDRPPNARPVVGWTGSRTTASYLATLHEPLLELQRRRSFELRVVGAQVELPGLTVTCVPWCAETEVEDLRPMDVGLMPLSDDPWTRGKCGFKALQYMALGIPPVVSPVGVNTGIVTHGVNGLHASTPGQWVELLSLLLDSRELRSRMGAAGRRTVERDFSARVHAPRVAAVLRSAAGLR